MNTRAFQAHVQDFYHSHGRHDLPWRLTDDAYKILTSEIMLQQTQVPRVIEKYHSFLSTFPTIQTLATASTDTLLREWKGLGYNRRALNFKRAAEQIVHDFTGNIPGSYEDLTSLPGIGPYTATAVQAFAFNKPSVVIETNIRTVVIKHFFRDTADSATVSDSEIIPLIEQTLDHTDPRTWYWALMDYGAHIKRTEKNYTRQSTRYTRQSAFKGSNRENRSRILSLVLDKPNITAEEIQTNIQDERTQKNIAALHSEGFLVERDGAFSIT